MENESNVMVNETGEIMKVIDIKEEKILLEDNFGFWILKNKNDVTILN